MINSVSNMPSFKGTFIIDKPSMGLVTDMLSATQGHPGEIKKLELSNDKMVIVTGDKSIDSTGLDMAIFKKLSVLKRQEVRTYGHYESNLYWQYNNNTDPDAVSAFDRFDLQA